MTTITPVEAKHTPGPWTIIPNGEAGDHPNHAFRFVGTTNFDEDTSTGEIIARLTDSPAIEANARLIAAAPDLFAACEDLIRLVDADHGEPVELARCRFDDIRAAIAKAGGA